MDNQRGAAAADTLIVLLVLALLGLAGMRLFGMSILEDKHFTLSAENRSEPEVVSEEPAEEEEPEIREPLLQEGDTYDFGGSDEYRSLNLVE